MWHPQGTYGDYYKPHLQTKGCGHNYMVTVFGLNENTFYICKHGWIKTVGSPGQKWAVVPSLDSLAILYTPCRLQVPIKCSAHNAL